MPLLHSIGRRGRRTAAVWLAAMALVPCGAAAAQTPSSSSDPACPSAVNALHGNPPLKHEAWRIAPQCGAAGGAALASAFQALAHEQLTAQQLIDLEAVMRVIRDASVLKSAQAVSLDASATPSMRTLALRLLLAQHDPGAVIASLGSSLTAGTACATRTASGLGQLEGAPLPADYVRQIDQTASTVLADGSAPYEARATARCIRRILDPSIPPSVDAAALSLTYVCGNKFRVRNANKDWADVTYSVEGTEDHGDLSVPPNGELEFTTDAVGVTRLYYNPGHEEAPTQLVQAVANGGTPCPQ